ncbi:putative nucleotidyltransferase substrate binding domain-containing protein [Acidovorax sp. SRB_24]|uniref:putative nucleotidyltransferase substrate binding domain-containing protein n=1 Tax=Acidovorax sp. SRB_24 TaxID=1962700 RepID=UPI00145F12F7|nr:putative nucleotidyltransferase substrate binding domain-containing protein [Acidovorax sp. SRB_24]NMM77685.1 cyclic nucleotide-binding protein [Acidovorax sp. SRB_24]
MPNAFNFAASPFDCLSLDEQRLVQDSVDIAYFPEGAVVLEVGAVPTHLFIPIKGYVTQTEGDEVLATYGPDDSFDGRGLVAGRVSSRFVAAQEVVAYQLARATVKELIARNTTFGALLFSDIGHKLSALAQRPDQHERQSLTLARVDAAYLRPAHTVDAGCDIVSVVRLFQAQRTTSVLVTGLAGGLGIFTNTTLQRAILDGRPLDRLAVGELASRPVVTVRASDQLGDAMALLLRERVHRVVVLDDEEKGGGVRGILEALDLFSFLANHSHLITVQIEQAQDLQALAQAAAQITRLIAALHRGGTRIGLMAKLVQQLNARLFERAWGMVAPAELVAHSCLFVMGSEGRGEQLLKTDQDNGLLLRDGYTAPHELDAICQRFSDVLERFGYPECPGRIMLSNPEWRGTASEFTRRVRQWLLLPEGDSLMNLAIFLDAHAVAGDAALLAGVRRGLMALATDNDALVARFAAAALQFDNGGGWWNRLLGLGDDVRQISLKKAGIFPIVHGVRSLALARRVTATGTAERVAALAADGTLDARLGEELVESLHFLMGLRLKAGLAEVDTGRAVTGNVDPQRLSSLERDLLKDALTVVKRFKALLHQRLRLDAL